MIIYDIGRNALTGIVAITCILGYFALIAL